MGTGGVDGTVDGTVDGMVDGMVSVVIACYNASATIGDQVAALAGQDDGGPWEVVVSDNGSTDGTPALLEELASRYPQLPLRVVDGSERRGAGPARNAGVRAARGTLLAFCDADDVVAPGWLAAVRTGLAEHEFLAGRFAGDLLNEPWMTRARQLDQSSGLQGAIYAPWLPHAGAGNLAVHRVHFEAVGGFDPDCRYLQDNDLCWRVQLLTPARLAFWPDAVVQVRLRGDLPGMYLQGLHFGSASAWLRARYAALGLEVSAEPGSAGSSRRRRAARLAWLRPQGRWDRGAVGHLLWQLGWRVGSRARRLGVWQPGGRPAPLRLPSRRPATASS